MRSIGPDVIFLIPDLTPSTWALCQDPIKNKANQHDSERQFISDTPCNINKALNKELSADLPEMV